MALKAPPQAQPSTWTGFYLGGSFGGQWGRDPISTSTPGANWAPGLPAVLDATSPTTLHPTGMIGGGQLGYDWQTGAAVLGVEADFNGLSGSASRTFLIPPPWTAGDFLFDQTATRFVATLRPRLGWTFGQMLIYGTGGYAFGSVLTTDTLAFNGATAFDTTSAASWRSGWAAGGGIEYAFTGAWSMKGEYLHVDLGAFGETLACHVAPCTSPIDSVVNHHYTDDIVRLGVNYHFGPFKSQ